MKTAAAIVCGMMLVLAQIFATQPAACSAPVKAPNCCHCGGKMACCANHQSSHAPASATVVQTTPQNEISFLPQTFSLLAPLSSVPVSVPVSAAILKLATLPIYTRDCALLI